MDRIGKAGEGTVWQARFGEERMGLSRGGEVGKGPVWQVRFTVETIYGRMEP